MRYAPNILSVSRFTESLKSLIEGEYAQVEIQGEVAELHNASSGHAYFTLQDDKARLACVIWRSTRQKQSGSLKNGQMLVVKGAIQLYPPHGKYQLVVRSWLDAGLGDALLRLEALKAELLKEGLFAPEKKRPLPPFPKRIGLITAPGSAALEDFLVTTQRRFFPDIIYRPSLVQGEDAPKQLMAALHALYKRKDLDVIVLTRGGGSSMDLLSFSDEALVRLVAKSPVPLVAAIGHEVDTSLVELAADHRAMTPTAAAHLVTRDRQLLKDDIHAQKNWLFQHMERRLGEAQQAHYFDKQRLLSSAKLRLDEAEKRAQRLLLKLEKMHPKAKLQAHQARWSRAEERHKQIGQRLISGQLERWRLAKERLLLLSPKANLERGWALLEAEDHSLLSSIKAISPGDTVYVTLKDGQIKATVKDSQPLGSSPKNPSSPSFSQALPPSE